MSDACEPMSPHGYLGRETETVEAIVNRMLKRPFSQEIPGKTPPRERREWTQRSR